jgi:hypothetical protein
MGSSLQFYKTPANKFPPHYTSNLHNSSNIIRKVKQNKLDGASSTCMISEMHKKNFSYKVTGIDGLEDLSINGKLKILK